MQADPKATGSAPPDQACNLWTQGLHAVLDRHREAPETESRMSGISRREISKCFPQAPPRTASTHLPMQDCCCRG